GTGAQELLAPTVEPPLQLGHEGQRLAGQDLLLASLDGTRDVHALLLDQLFTPPRLKRRSSSRGYRFPGGGKTRRGRQPGRVAAAVLRSQRLPPVAAKDLPLCWRQRGKSRSSRSRQRVPRRSLKSTIS